MLSLVLSVCASTTPAPEDLCLMPLRGVQRARLLQGVQPRQRGLGGRKGQLGLSLLSGSFCPGSGWPGRFVVYNQTYAVVVSAPF